MRGVRMWVSQWRGAQDSSPEELGLTGPCFNDPRRVGSPGMGSRDGHVLGPRRLLTGCGQVRRPLPSQAWQTVQQGASLDLTPSRAESGFGVQPECDSCSALHLHLPERYPSASARLWVLCPMSGLYGKARTQPSAPTLGCHPASKDQRRPGQPRSLRRVLESGQGWGVPCIFIPIPAHHSPDRTPSILSDRWARLLGGVSTALAFNFRFTDTEKYTWSLI